MDVGTAYDRRIKDQAFTVKWAAALAKASEKGPLHRLRRSPSPGKPGEELVLRRTKHGDKLVRAAEGRWCARTEDLFFAELGRTGCVRAAAEAAELSTNALYYRRDKYPEFAERWRAVEEAAAERLPGLLRAASIASLDPEVATKRLPLVNIDQAIAISRLKAPGGGDPNAKNRASRKRATPEELTASILKHLAVLRKRKLARGWTEIDDGRMIPPGWVRG